jgi:hypothetical protein
MSTALALQYSKKRPQRGGCTLGPEIKRRGATRAVGCQPTISRAAWMVCFDHFSNFFRADLVA